jgi:hypothetical protein
MAENTNKSSALALTLLLAVLLQVVFAFADGKDTPQKAAVEFSKAYFMVDPGMSRRVCDRLLHSEGTNMVKQIIENRDREAQQMGFSPKFMKCALFHVKTEILSQDENSAKVRLTAVRKRNLNPVFTFIGRLFNLGTTYEVDQVLELVREKGRWKVCGLESAGTMG